MIQLNRTRIVVRWSVVFLKGDQVETSTSRVQEILHASMSVLCWTCLLAREKTVVNTNSGNVAEPVN